MYTCSILYTLYLHLFFFPGVKYTPPVIEFVEGGAVLYRGRRREEIFQKNKTCETSGDGYHGYPYARARGLLLPVTDTPQDKQ